MNSVIKKIFIILFMVLMPLSSTYAALTYQGTTNTISNTADMAGLPKNTFDSLLTDILSWLLAIFTILAVISFIISGLMFLFAGANKELADKARKGVMYSIVGIAVALSAYIIIFLINSLLKGTASVGGSSTGSTGISI